MICVDPANPATFNDPLTWCAQRGYRIVGIARNLLEANTMVAAGEADVVVAPSRKWITHGGQLDILTIDNRPLVAEVRRRAQAEQQVQVRPGMGAGQRSGHRRPRRLR